MTPAERQERLLERIAIALEGIRENTREKTWEENRSQWEISPGEIPPSTICKKCYGKGFTVNMDNDPYFLSTPCSSCLGTGRSI